MPPTFVPPAYEGPNLDHAEYIKALDGTEHHQDTSHTRDQMEDLRKYEDAHITPPVLPESLQWLEYRAPHYYINQILSLAAEKGTRVVFLYLPRFEASQTCPDYKELYSQRVALINPSALMQDNSLWQDAIHMNWRGAKLVTDYVSAQIASLKLLDGDNKPKSARAAP
jgi:hypothetical protein